LKLWLPLICGTLLAAMGLHYSFGGRSTRFDELALGKETSSYWAKIGEHPIHCSPPVDIEECIAGFKARGANEAAIWLGNSQVHAINQMKSGDSNAPPLLHDALKTHSGVDLLTFSQPNASLQEHLVLFQHLRTRLPIKLLILPLVFDDLRETGLRSEIGQMINDPATEQSLIQSDIGMQIIRTARASGSTLAAINSGKNDLEALHETTQEKTELAFNSFLEKYSSLWKSRGEARGTLLTRLFFLRNQIFGINAQTARPLIPGRRALNIHALQEILTAAREARISVSAYVVPIRNDVEIPYVAEEYRAFKEEAAAITAKYDAKYSNFENLIPSRYWGSGDSTNLDGTPELDFMHFRAPGHRLLANALADMVTQVPERQASR
jgi:hypothetical protein